ncbi:hypothetical protein HYH02_002806 [Chlamydomonas schloesseri]|uniref:Uncharacterized protein n=1 Tax=Chlamydomonas schloesseri TaxID=2026947 RepID=A0A835WSH6_9CHLO|nr:hypothetical protein HYH02_002806 [Chlamydomonas schloesseri]|eukprot:KAG2452569.1 hypothetical protein HYH02_002806 [Chlamydomonas schloesseri]
MSSVEPPNGVGAAPAHEAAAEAGSPAGASGRAPAANGDGSASHAPVAAVSTPAAPVTLPPPGYVLVTLHLEGQERPALLHLPVEVLPNHTFMDVCAAALARVPDVPPGHCLQAAFLESGGARLPLHEPHVLARAVLRAFAPDTCLQLHVGAPAMLVVTGKRLAKVVPRRQRTWPKALARAAIGVAKFVLAVEAAALLRGGVFSFLRRVRRGGADSATDSGTGTGSAPEDGGRRGRSRRDLGGETEAALEAVAAYVTGRGELMDLAGFRPELVVGALEAMDTEVLEQLEVPDVAETRAAVREMVAQFRRDHEAAAAAAAQQQEQQQQQPSRQGEGAAGALTSGRDQQQAAGRTGGRPSAQADMKAEAKGDAVAEPLPGFGPAKSGAPGAGGLRGSGGGGTGASR